MTDVYNPPEHLIEAVLKDRTPRQIAIAYLRAMRRARQAEQFAKISEAVSETAMAAMTGDTSRAEAAVDAAERAWRMNMEIRG